MRTGSLAFLAGIITILQLYELPSVIVSLSLLLVALIICLFKNRHLTIAGLFILGFAWASLRADLILSQHLPIEIEGQPVLATGKVVSLPEVYPDRTRFVFEIEHLQDRQGNSWPSPGRVRVSWYYHAASLQPGETWQLQLKLKRPWGFSNPGGFDYERWLFLQRIRATGYVMANTNAHKLDKAHSRYPDRVRLYVRHHILGLFPHNQQTGLIVALVTGDRSVLTNRQRTILRNTGTSHLLAISGLHIGLVAGFFYFLIRRLWCFSKKLPLRYPAQYASMIGACCAALMYGLLAGMSLPTQRALVMLGVAMVFMLVKTRVAFSSVICCALTGVLIYDPMATMDAGFWLSFIAVALIAFSVLNQYRRESLWSRWGRVQLILFIGLAPLILFWYQQLALTAILANLIAVPFVGFIVMPLLLTGTLLLLISPVIALPVLKLAELGLATLMTYLEWLSNNPVFVWHHAAPDVSILLFAMAGIWVLMQPRGLPARWIGIIWVIPVFFPPVTTVFKPGEFRLVLLDVGQGLAAVVETREHTLVFDSGPAFGDNFNAGEAVIIPYLRHAGINRIDKLVISHGDNDHIGGSTALLREFPRTSVLTSVPNRFDRLAVDECENGQHWNWDGVNFRVLNPDRDQPGNGNNRSCVLKVGKDELSLLLTGDIEHVTEARLSGRQSDNLPATVLIAPHHGSKTSSTPGFLRLVNPEWVLYPVGYRNRFKLPNQDIIARYQSQGVRQLDTAHSGAITVSFTRQGIRIICNRQQTRRFWHTQ